MKNNYAELLVVSGMLIVTVLLLNPFGLWMPDMMVMGMLVGALVLFSLFASFVLREKAKDERDEMHRSLAGRNSFLAGAAMLILGIVWQGQSHTVDAWLVGALIVMVGTKLATRLWADKNL